MSDLKLQKKEFMRSLQADNMRMVERLYMAVLDLLETHMRYLALAGKPGSGAADLPLGLGEFATSRGGPTDEDFWLDVLAFVWPRLTEGLDAFADFNADLLEKNPKSLWLSIENSRTDPLAWKTLEALLRRRSSLAARAAAAPADDRAIWWEMLSLLIGWACEVAGKTRIEPPLPQGRNHTEDMLRNAAIRATVQKIHDCNGKPYTSALSQRCGHEERSACGMVAQRLPGVPYATVLTIWRRRLNKSKDTNK